MISRAYAKAYTEVLEIISYFPEEEYAKIPKEKIEFYEKNRERDYTFSIDPKIDLSEQNISKEANAIIVNLFRDYYANEKQKDKIKEILENNQKKEEEKKREKYNPDNKLKKNNKQNIINEKLENNIALIEYKESFFFKLKKFIFSLLHKKDKNN